MNKDTIRKCAEMAARHQLNALGYVEEDIQALLAELDAPEPEPEPVAKKKGK